jgi:hypothetical protein
MGLGFITKNNFALLVLGLVAGVFLTDIRRSLRDRWLWFGVLAAAIIVLPYLFWQVQNDWPVVEFARNAAGEKNAQIDPVGFLALQLLIMHPLTLPIWLAGLIWIMGAREARPYRLLAYLYLVPCAILVATRSARPDYLSPAYVILLAAGAVVIERGLRRFSTGWIRVGGSAAVIAALLLGGAALVPLSLPVLPPAALANYASAVGLTDASMERGKTAPLPQYYADRFGWPEMAATIGRVYETLSPQDKADTVIFAGNYGEAGALDFFGRAYGLPPAISGHNNYFLWGPGAASGEVAIIVGVRDVTTLRQQFAQVEQAALITCDYCMDYEDNVPVYVARGPRVPLSELWPHVKHYG